MILKMQCFVAMGFSGPSTDRNNTEAVKRIKSQVNGYSSGVAYLAAGLVDDLRKVNWSGPFLDAHIHFRNLSRNKSFEEDGDTRAFINTRYDDVDGANQTGGNGGGGDAAGKGRHRASLVDSGAQYCAWRIDSQPIKSKIEKIPFEWTLSTSRTQGLSAADNFDYKEKHKAVYDQLPKSYNYARYFADQAALNAFKITHKNDFAALEACQAHLTVPMGIKEVAGGFHAVLKFDSLDQAFDWLTTKGQGLEIRKDPTPIVEIITF